jgi:hypothetical protein
MPYELRRVKGGHQIVSKDTGKVHSKKPMSKSKAKAQMRALYANVPDASK